MVDETAVLEFKNGTFEAIEDSVGLRIEASFDGKDLTTGEVSRLEVRMLLRYRVIQQTWSEDYRRRLVREVALRVQ